MIKVVILRCVNLMCRIETFKGAYATPFSTCPNCGYVCAEDVLQKEKS